MSIVFFVRYISTMDYSHIGLTAKHLNKKNKKMHNELEAQWAEPVSLTFHSALRKLNT